MDIHEYNFKASAPWKNTELLNIIIIMLSSFGLVTGFPKYFFGRS